MAWKFTLRGETPTKHAFALGQTATPPPVPALRSTADFDGIAAPIDPARAAHPLLESSYTPRYPVTSTASSITIAAFTAITDEGASINFPGHAFDNLTAATAYVITWSLSTLSYTITAAPALDQITSPDNVIVRYYSTASVDGTYPAEPTPPAGDGGGGYGGGGRYNQNTVQE
jgi:hypothetical protein